MCAGSVGCCTRMRLAQWFIRRVAGQPRWPSPRESRPIRLGFYPVFRGLLPSRLDSLRKPVETYLASQVSNVDPVVLVGLSTKAF